MGTRGSTLAIAQTAIVCDALRRVYPGIRLRIERITTLGDARHDAPLSQLGRGVFVTEIEAALHEGRIDLAVHSAKDLPSRQPEGLTLAAFPPRGDPRDMLVMPADCAGWPRDHAIADLDALARALPEGARVGTSSLRRSSQLRALRPGLRLEDMRGNVDSRLRALAAGRYDALVLAAAGLQRLGFDTGAPFVSDHASFSACAFDPLFMLPAVAQGALALETRAADLATIALARGLDDTLTRRCVEAERACLRRLEGGCQAPIAAYARASDDGLEVRGLVASIDGGRFTRAVQRGALDSAEALGLRLAESLLAGGAQAILDEITASEAAKPALPLRGRRIVLTRPADRADGLSARLRALGAEAIHYPVIAYAPPEDTRALNEALKALAAGEYTWLIVTSAQAAQVAADGLGAARPAARIAAVGEATAASCLRLLGATPEVVPERYAAGALAQALGGIAGARALLLNADIASPELEQALAAKGARVDRVVAYRTIPAAADPAVDMTRLLADGRIDAILFASGSAVRHFAARLGGPVAQQTAVICIGPATAHVAKECGLPPTRIAAEATEAGLIDALLSVLST